MTRNLQQFLATRLPFPGLGAWSVRLPDGTQTSQCYAERLTAARVQQAFDQLVLAANNLAGQGVQPLRMVWTFENLLVCLALRSDITLLAFFVERRPGLTLDGLEQALTDFQNEAGYEVREDEA